MRRKDKVIAPYDKEIMRHDKVPHFFCYAHQPK